MRRSRTQEPTGGFMKSRGHSIAVALVAAVVTLVPSAAKASSLIGDTVNCAMGPGQAICSPASAVVGAGNEFTLFLGSDPLFSVNVADSSVTFTLIDSIAFGFGSDLVVLSDLDFTGAPAGITGLQ